DPARALATTDSLTALSAADLAAAGVTDPFFRTVLHLSRARWLAALGRRDDAARELLWYQANDYVNLPTGAPQAGDADAAFGTLARWRLAALRDAAGERGETVCRAYRDVARLWAAGATPYGARADSGARRAAALAWPRIWSAVARRGRSRLAWTGRGRPPPCCGGRTWRCSSTSPAPRSGRAAASTSSGSCGATSRRRPRGIR